MSIKELVPYGFTEHQLKQFLKIKGFPAYKAPGKTSKWHIDTTKLDSWLMRRFGTKATIDKYLFQMLDAAAWLSYRLPLKDRLYVASQYIRKYREYVSTKNLLILLFKRLIKA